MNLKNPITEHKNHKIYVPFTLKYLKDFEKKLINNSDKTLHYFISMRNHLLLTQNTQIDYQKTLIQNQTLETLEEKLAYINLNIDKFIIISPEATTCTYYSKTFWSKLVNKYKENGYDIFLNILDSNNYIEGTKSIFLTIKEILALAPKAKRIIGVRSGLIEMLLSANVPMDILYTNCPLQGIKSSLTKKAFSVKNLPFANKAIISEYDTEEECEESLITQCLATIHTV